MTGTARSRRSSGPERRSLVSSQNDPDPENPSQLLHVGIVYSRQKKLVRAFGVESAAPRSTGSTVSIPILIPRVPDPCAEPVRVRTVRRSDGSRRPLEERPRRRGLGKGDDVPQAPHPREVLHDPVHTQRDPAMWRGPGPQRLEEEAELPIDLLRPPFPDDPQHPCAAALGSWIRMLPEPNSEPLYTRSYASPRTEAGSSSSRSRSSACGSTKG
jgi:hypothetical protein